MRRRIAPFVLVAVWLGSMVVPGVASAAAPTKGSGASHARRRPEFLDSHDAPGRSSLSTGPNHVHPRRRQGRGDLQPRLQRLRVPRLGKGRAGSQGESKRSHGSAEPESLDHRRVDHARHLSDRGGQSLRYRCPRRRLHRGGARIAILDTGIDLDHPDLPRTSTRGSARTARRRAPPQDGHGHGTHVAGIAAAARGNGDRRRGRRARGARSCRQGARRLRQRRLDNVICGIDYVTGLKTDGDPSNDVDVVNMSLGDTGPIGNCSDGGLRAGDLRVGGRWRHLCRGARATRRSTRRPSFRRRSPRSSRCQRSPTSTASPAASAAASSSRAARNDCDDTIAFFSNYGGVGGRDRARASTCTRAGRAAGTSTRAAPAWRRPTWRASPRS